MKTHKDRELVYEVSPYGKRLHIVVAKDLLKAFRKRGLKASEADSPDGNSYAFVWTSEGCNEIYAFLPEDCGLGATAHEMFHVVAFIMRRHGVGFNEEAWAYHLEDLTQRAAEFVHHKQTEKYRKAKTK